jgi:hypothetical protein
MRSEAKNRALTSAFALIPHIHLITHNPLLITQN